MRSFLPAALAAALLAACSSGERPADTTADARTNADSAAATACPAGNDTTLVLPSGFCATVFADVPGGPRHIVVAPNGDVYTAMSSTRKSRAEGALAEIGTTEAGFVVGLRDANNDGRADSVAQFGTSGGTGIALFDGHVYVDQGERILRWARPEGSLAPTGQPQTVVSGLPMGGHQARSFAIDRSGAMFVNIGSRSDVCQVKDRQPGSRGQDPCTELETRAGIWRFDARATNQRPSPQSRYATGIRNALGVAIGPDGRLWATQHGRDGLHMYWPQMFDEQYQAENPLEELQQVNQGDDFGWPYCYVAAQTKQRVVAPEYGGNGTEAARCARFKAPVATFPGHWAPMSLLFYSGSQFPERYRNGAFIAFHGSWNRAPLPQAGYQVVFQPLNGDRANGDFETFIDGFAGADKSPRGARHRPAGLAQGPDGSIYVTDDVNGRIWKITYRGGR